jgi:hypothetical protein
MTDKTKLPDARRVPEELKPFLIEVARLIANDILREEAEHQKRPRARSEEVADDVGE